MTQTQMIEAGVQVEAGRELVEMVKPVVLAAAHKLAHWWTERGHHLQAETVNEAELRYTSKPMTPSIQS